MVVADITSLNIECVVVINLLVQSDDGTSNVLVRNVQYVCVHVHKFVLR